MKHIRRTLALLLAAALMLTLSIAAFADGTADTGSITINNAVKDKTYTIYRIFDLNSHNEDYTAFNYTVNASWADFFKEGAAGLTYVTIDELGYVTWNNGTDAAEFAKAAIQFAKGSNITNDGQQTASDSTVTFGNLPLGYYLVQSDLGILCALDTTLPNVTIKEKNSAPTVEKKVRENDAYGKTNDANIGDVVTFQTTINVLDGAPKSYVLHDKMSAGLTFNTGSVKVTVNDVESSDYTVTTPTDGCSFEIQFHTLKPNDVITVEYTATVNANAVIAGSGNTNETWLDYGDNQHTEKDTTRTYVWDMKVVKFTMKGETETPLMDAQFVLYKISDADKEYVYVDNNGKVAGWTQHAHNAAESPRATVFTTPADGTFTISGLDSGTYYLEEIKAPAGYNMLKDAIAVTINTTINAETNVGTATLTYHDSSADKVKVENQTGTELPSTGGIGTTIFYIIGSLLAVGAVILLVTRKRMGKPED